MKKTFITKEKIEEIAAKIPTPFHVYDEAGIRKNAENVKKAFAWNKGFREYFAVKATPNPTLIKILGEYIGVDACAANLMRPAIYGAYHHITVAGKENATCDHLYDVTGSLCENCDKFAIDRKLPKIDMGDYLIIHDAGAHGHSMGYNYNGKLRSSEVLLKTDGSFQMIRRAETPKDYFATLDFTDEYKKMFGDK